MGHYSYNFMMQLYGHMCLPYSSVLASGCGQIDKFYNFHRDSWCY